MARVIYSNADNAASNNKGNSGILTLDKNRLAILQMMQKNPEMATGYLIGNAIGSKYWGDKQAKSRAEANFMTLHPDATRDQFNQYYKAIKSGMSRNDALAQIGLAPMREYGAGDTGGVLISRDASGNLTGISAGPQSVWDAREKALNEFKNGGGKVLYSGRTGKNAVVPSADNIPRTPQQMGQHPVTLDNAGALGGVQTPQQAYQDMAKGVTYNNGNTPTGYAAYNGVRDQGNVMGGNTPANPMPEIPTADIVPPTPAVHGGSIDPNARGGGGANLGAFQRIPEVVDAAPNLAVENNPLAAYGLADESDVNTGGGLLKMALAYLTGGFSNGF